MTVAGWSQAAGDSLAAHLNSLGGVQLPLQDHRTDLPSSYEVRFRADKLADGSAIFSQKSPPANHGWWWTWHAGMTALWHSNSPQSGTATPVALATKKLLDIRAQYTGNGDWSYFNEGAKVLGTGKQFVGDAKAPLKVSMLDGRVYGIRVMQRPIGVDEDLAWPALGHGLVATALVVGCDDGNACTADDVGPAGQCDNAPTTSIACNAGGKPGVCDGGGTCKATGACPLFDVAPFDKDPGYAAWPIAMPDGGWFVAGYTSAGGNGQARATRLDAAGKPQWTKDYGGASNDEVYRAIATQGGFLLIGGTQSYGGGNWDQWALRITADGQLVWQHVYGAKHEDKAFAATEDGNGGYVLAGRGRPGSGTTGEGRITWLDGAGKVTAAKIHGGSGDDRFYDITDAPGQGHLVVGSTTSKGAGDKDGWAVRLAGDGTALWDRVYGGKGMDQATSVVPHAGGYLVSGTTDSSGAGDWDVWLLHIDDNGDPLAELTVGGASEDGPALGGVVPVAGGFVIGGQTKSKGAGKRDMWLLQVDAAGKTVWERTWGVSGFDDESFGLARGLNGGWLLAGRVVNKWKLVHVDAWGNTKCDTSGLCAYTSSACEDGKPCTADACNAKTGCTHTPIKDCTPAKDMDLDHDGLVGAADPCPTVWNPDADKVRGSSSCAPWDAKGAHKGWSQSQPAKLRQPGLAAPYSDVRRTNEPVELPLVNGIRDSSLVGYWKLDGDFVSSAGESGGTTTVGKPTATQGPFGPASKAMLFNGSGDGAYLWKGRKTTLGSAFSVSLWYKGPQKYADGGDDILVTNDGGTAGSCHGKGFYFYRRAADGKLVFWLTYAGKNDGDPVWPTVKAPEDGLWHHVAAVFDSGRMAIYLDGRLASWKSVPGLPSPVDCGNWLDVAQRYHWKDKKSAGWFQGAMADLAVFARALKPAEIATYAASRAAYGSSFVAGAQSDFDDVRVTESPDVQNGARLTHTELSGVRPHSDTNLDGVMAYWRFDGDGANVLAGGAGANVSNIQWSTGRFGSSKGGLATNTKNSTVDLPYPSLVGHGAMSFEFWFSPKTAMTAKTPRADLFYAHSAAPKLSYLTLIYQGSHGDGKPEWQGALATTFMVDGDSWSVHSQHVDFVPGVWYHLAVSRDASGKPTIYVNGVDFTNRSTDHKTGSGAPKMENAGQGWWRLGYSGSGSHRIAASFDELIVHKVARPADYFAKRARGLPRVRFLAHTTAHPSGGGHAFNDYTLRWGNNAAKAVATKVVALDKKTVCDGLLSPCLGYVGWWRMDSAGGSAIDTSTWRQHGAIHAGATPISGRAGVGLAFDGKTGALRIPHAKHFDLQQLTVQASARLPNSKPSAHIMTCGGGGSGDNYGLYRQADGRVQFRYEYGGPKDAFALSKAPPASDTWIDIAGSLDAKELRGGGGGARGRPAPPALATRTRPRWESRPLRSSTRMAASRSGRWRLTNCESPVVHSKLTSCCTSRWLDTD